MRGPRSPKCDVRGAFAADADRRFARGRAASCVNGSERDALVQLRSSCLSRCRKQALPGKVQVCQTLLPGAREAEGWRRGVAPRLGYRPTPTGPPLGTQPRFRPVRGLPAPELLRPLLPRLRVRTD